MRVLVVDRVREELLVSAILADRAEEIERAGVRHEQMMTGRGEVLELRDQAALASLSVHASRSFSAAIRRERFCAAQGAVRLAGSPAGPAWPSRRIDRIE